MILKITYPEVSSIGLSVFTWYVDVMFPTCERVGIMSILQLWKLKLRKITWVDQWYVHWEREELKFSYKCYNISAFIYTTLHIKYMKISYMRIYIYIYIYTHTHTHTHTHIYTCTHAHLLQLCLTSCNPMDSSPPGASVIGIPQDRILEPWPPPGRRDQARDQTRVSCVSYIASGFFTHWAAWEAYMCVCVCNCI